MRVIRIYEIPDELSSKLNFTNGVKFNDIWNHCNTNFSDKHKKKK